MSTASATPTPVLPNGGDSRTEDLNVFFVQGDLAWIMTSTALVFIMTTAGVGFFYSGLARRKSALSLIWLALMSHCVISLQWFIWGYSLVFSKNGSPILGTLANACFRETLAYPAGAIPDLLFAIYQNMFATITAALAIGAAAERGRMLPCIVFVFVWSTIVYDPLAHWTWSSNGWLYGHALDFAGGTPVHISSGTAALAYSIMLGKRRGHGTHELNYRPHNVAHVVLGTIFLFFGWFGFNGGSAAAANLNAVIACVVTNIAACMGGIVWCLMDYRLERKWSTVGMCSGIIAGLVAITPASGYVPPWSAVIIGAVGAAVCNYATKLKYLIGVDDALDIFAVHGIGGMAGDILTALFAADYIMGTSGSVGADLGSGGWLSHHYVQLGWQLADLCAGFSWTFVFTCIILFIMNLIPGLSLRASESDELKGIDDAEIGEFAYDFVLAARDCDAPRDDDTPATAVPTTGSTPAGMTMADEQGSASDEEKKRSEAQP